MRAKQKMLCVLLALVVFMAICLAGLLYSNAKADQAASASAEGTISLSAFAVEELSSIVYTYNGETISLDYDGDTWTMTDDKEYHLDQTKCNTMATSLSTLNAKRQLTAQPGEDYGLSEPTVSITVTAAGKSKTFYFGASNAMTGDVYLQMDGDDAVYTVSSSKISCFQYVKTELFDPFNPAGVTSSSIERVEYTIRTSDGKNETVCLMAVSVLPEGENSNEDEDSAAYATVWQLASDPGAVLDEDTVNGILSALGGYVSGQITHVEDFSEYGLDEPMISVAVNTPDGTAILHYAVGSDGYYMAIDGDESVYIVDNSILEAFKSAQELKAEE